MTQTLLSVDQVAARFGMSPASVRRRSLDGSIPAPKRIGGLLRWSVAELEKFEGKEREKELRATFLRMQGLFGRELALEYFKDDLTIEEAKVKYLERPMVKKEFQRLKMALGENLARVAIFTRFRS